MVPTCSSTPRSTDDNLLLIVINKSIIITITISGLTNYTSISGVTSLNHNLLSSSRTIHIIIHIIVIVIVLSGVHNTIILPTLWLYTFAVRCCVLPRIAPCSNIIASGVFTLDKVHCRVVFLRVNAWAICIDIISSMTCRPLMRESRWVKRETTSVVVIVSWCSSSSTKWIWIINYLSKMKLLCLI